LGALWGVAVASLVFASLVTFGILVRMVVGLVLAAMVAAGEVNVTLAIGLTVVINLLIWLVSPWLSDLTLRWFNSLEFLDDAAVKQRYPGVHQLIHPGADDYRFKVPRVGFIPDRNPTCVHELLAREAEARAKGLGVWGSSLYRVASALDLKRLGRLIHSYQLVEGTVAAVGEGGGRIYLNFAKDWRSDFTISVDRKDAPAFATA
jgi:hypothetical protein